MMIMCILAACQTREVDSLSYLPGDLHSEGRSFIVYCNSCHAAPHPARHTLDEWRSVLVHMEKRMQERGVQTPDKHSRIAIVQYLRKYARQ